MEHLVRSGNQKKKTRFTGLFFLTGLQPVLPLGQCPPSKSACSWKIFFPLRFSDASSRSGLTHFSPHSNIYRHYTTSSEAAPGASPGQVKTCKVSLAKRSSKRLKLWTLKFYFELFKPGVFSPEVFRPKSELSEAFIRTSQFELWTFQTRNFKLLRVHFELWNFNLNFSILFNLLRLQFQRLTLLTFEILIWTFQF